MPPKRSAQSRDGDEDPRSPKRPKTTPTSERGSRKSPSDSTDDENGHKVPVSWALPTPDKKANAGDRTLAEIYAQALYGRELSQLDIMPGPFGFPRIRTPLFRGPSRGPLEPGRHDNKSGQPVCDLFERIKKDTKPLNSGENRQPPTSYARNKFELAFESENDVAVVASRSTAANRVLALTEDYWVQATLHDDNDDDRTQSAQLHFIRRSPTTASTSDTPATNHAYFIELPAETRVTINGTTYINDRSQDQDDDGFPFIVGSLIRYTVIELLSQPIFFFRNRTDLNHTEPLNDTGPRARPSARELENRISNQHVTVGRGEIIWSAAQLFRAQSASSPLVPPEPPRFTSPLAEDEPVEYDDSFTNENGEEIKSADIYIQNRLLAGLRGDTPLRAINAVLLSINDRQEPNNGYSVSLEDTVLRPGRPLFMPLPVQEDYFVLLLFQATQNGLITLHVFDPRYWDSIQKQRESIVTRALELLLTKNWLTNVFHGANIATRLQPAQWVLCAQTTQPQYTSIYTILNAWAIAMDLPLRPVLNTSGTARQLFMREAHLLIRSVTDGVAQDWRSILAFFRKWGYVQDCNNAMPLNDRRFDQTKRSLDTLLLKQRKEDLKWRSSHDRVHPTNFIEAVRLDPNGGGIYTEVFRADGQTSRYRNGLVRHLVGAGRWDPGMDDAQLKTAFATLLPPNRTLNQGSTLTANPSPPPTNVPDSTPPQTSRQPRQGTEVQSNDILDPCAHLKESLKQLRKRSSQTWALPIHEENALVAEDVENSILAVLQAVNQRQSQPGQLDYVHHGQLYGDFRCPKVRNLCIFPRFHRSHTFLCIVRRNPEADGGVSIYVIDSAPWTLKLADRVEQHDRICDTLKDIGWVDNTTVPNHTTWVFGARQIDPQHASCYTVLNAWSIIFEMQLKPNFRPQQGFFALADEIIRAAVRGDANWSIIWSFLRCKMFAKSEPLGSHYRFEKTISVAEANHEPTSNHRNFEMPEHVVAHYDEFATMDSKIHHDVFEWDDWEKEDIETRYPVAAQVGIQPNSDRHVLRTAYDVFQYQPRTSSEPFEEGFKPCLYFRRESKRLLASSDVELLLIQLGGKAVPNEASLWLQGEQVSLAIASVTQAITTVQMPTGGFSTIHDYAVTTSLFNEPFDVSPVIRFGRPLLVPVVHGGHIVLLVVQFEDDRGPTISVLDLKAFYYSKEQRDVIFRAAQTLIQSSGWGRHSFGTARGVELPSHAVWIAGAHQPSDSECGYYTVLNAWALALGLQPNVQFAPVWNDIFPDVRDMVQLVRIGCADWRLIYAFLRCIRFVHESDVPHSRRFTNTLRLPTESLFMDYMQAIRREEDRFWTDRQDLTRDLPATEIQNSVQLPVGLPHNQDFPSDKWTLLDRIDDANGLAQIGRLRSSMTTGRLRECYSTYTVSKIRDHHERQGVDRASRFLRWNLPETGAISLQRLHSRHADFVLGPGAQRGISERMASRPCMVSSEGLAFLGAVMNDRRIKSIIAELPLSTQWKQSLEISTVNLAIASVVQALDCHQFGIFQGKSDGAFNSGFSLATTTSVDMTKMADPDASRGCCVSRPRRCWLLPLTVTSEEIHQYKLRKGEKPKHIVPTRAHTFLVVIQEEAMEEKEEGVLSKPKEFQEFQVYFLDSASHIFEDDHVYLYQRVVNIAYRLGWASHRNGSGSKRRIVTFAEELSIVRVPQQTRENRNACGYHTILNAWIVAMGLTPDRKTPLTETLYAELNLLTRVAVAGLLDWQTLIAWFFCNGLVREASEEVELHRRFGLTEHQDNNEQKLEEYIIYAHSVHDIALQFEEIGHNEPEYNFESNMDWGLILNKMIIGHVGKPVIPDNALNRAYDDADLDFFKRRQRRHQVAEEVRGISLSFLDDFAESGDVMMTGTTRSGHEKTSKSIDVLDFLDAY